MKDASFATPPKKPSEHHGMADRKPQYFMQINTEAMEKCRRKLLFDDEDLSRNTQKCHSITSLRF